MIAIDTGVLASFLVEDDAGRSRLSRMLVEKAGRDGERIFLSDLVLVGTARALSRAYGIGRKEIASALGRLLLTRNVEFESSDRLARALAAWAAGRGDLSGYLVRERAVEMECSAVVTFDDDLVGEKGFRRP